MFGYQLLYLASLITFTVGALAFSALTLFYWRERRLRRRADHGGVFPTFTLVCAAAFLLNLLLRLAGALGEASGWVAAGRAAVTLVTALLPPLLAHLVYRDEWRDLPLGRVWRWLLAGFYLISTAGALLETLDDAELVVMGDWLDDLPALALGTAGALGLLMQAVSRRRLTPVERHHRWWKRVLLALMALCALVNLTAPEAFLSLLPDYLLLGFFSVTLYYQERLVFFDLLLKRGAFLALALVGLTLLFVVGPGVVERFPQGWSRPWISALLLTPFFLLGPWIYGRLARAIDHVWLRRRYSSAEAEQRFARDIQIAETEEDLADRAARSLTEIFQAPAEVRFSAAGGPPASPNDGLVTELEQRDVRLGWLVLPGRPNSIAYLSDDRRLLDSLARTLSVVLENTRFRQQRQRQEEREQELRWLASRAELKALRAQINPHFLFNALNAIAGLIPDQPRLAEETVEQLAEVFRYTLRKAEKEWVRLDEEVEFARAYLRVEQARFGERLQVECHVDPAAGAVLVPAMSIQPLAENAVKHGVSQVEGGGKVGLRAELKGEMLWIEVRDNGPGFPPGFGLAGAAAGQPSAGHGLRNIAERLRGYYGEAAELRWEHDQGWTRVILRIPRSAAGETGGEKC